VAIERIALSLVQLGRDSDDLTRDIATKDTVMEKVRSVVDGERAKHTLDRVESLRGEMRRMRSDAQALKNLLLDLENPMAQISLQLECIQDGLDSKSMRIISVVSTTNGVVEQERRKIMRWLSTEQYTAHHKTIARTRLPGSGLWLFKKLEYQKWWESSLCSLLWLHGDRKCTLLK
jgi:septal ring factor EnvC (AmiA/AmiB activator)